MKKNALLLRSLVLTLPLIFFLVHHYTRHDPSLHATGFTQEDNLVYMANARQYLEGNSSGLAYANPFSHSSPNIYSQPYNFILLLFLVLSADPGMALSFFGLLSAWACIYITLRLVRHLYPQNGERADLQVTLIWGGGLTAIAGLLLNGLIFQQYTDFSDGIYLIDPGAGWWGMNYGRTLMIPVEAFYHLLFIGAIFAVILHRWVLSFILSVLLCWSHPFTGIEFLSIVAAWLGFEKLFWKNRDIPLSFCFAFAALMFFHLWYYLVFLNRFEEHRLLFEQFSVSWGYSWKVFIPAYILVGILAFVTMFRKRLQDVFEKEHQRLFFLWAVIAFLLSNHEWFMKPIQPIHFTRGYIWLGLFLFGIPGFLRLAGNLKLKVFWYFFLFLMLSDNLLWYAKRFSAKAKNESVAHVSDETKQVLQWLSQHSATNTLLVSNEYRVSYMANAYSSSWSWTGHLYNTPGYAERNKITQNFLRLGVADKGWRGKQIFILIDKSERTGIHASLKNKKIYESHRYVVFELNL